MKKIPIGISDFKKLITENYYYVDKTLFIKDIVEDGSSVILMPRPRRFGKTLNMSILKYFYQKTEEDNKFLFENLNIQNHKEVMQKQGQYPVIYITFKDEKYSNFGDLKNGFKLLIANLYRNHDYLLDSDKLSDVEKNEFYNILNKEVNIIHFSKSLYLLSSSLICGKDTPISINGGGIATCR
ncbi:MAG: AAA family ATPase [Tepidibacter sp.]|uniref:AAA family ATPase n=1 Tax=Tepidibacter sp. TaxID=2529387 RepID=UPI0025E3EBEF|nr:AAA family ATPase [Tepidibacter sp.]MCT4507455.1 AAA family ATPase [Tepidibacter sp.]